MEEIIHLLQQKNDHLEKFCELNEVEMDAFSRGDFSRLDKFYNEREKILRLIRHIDKTLEKMQLAEKDPVQITPAEKAKIQEIMAAKDVMVTQILSQDLQILSYIDREKSALIQELRGVTKTRKAIGSYKSPSVLK